MKNERGYALILVLLTIVLIGVIGFSLITVSSNTLNTSANERVNQSSFYIAEAGINIKAARIQQLVQLKYADLKDHPTQFDVKYKDAIKDILDAESHSTYNQDHFTSTVNGTPKADVTVDFDPSDPFEFVITSIGKLDNKHVHRVLEKEFFIQPDPLVETVTNEQQPGEPVLVTPTQPVNAANIYVTEDMDLEKVLDKNFNANVAFRQSTNITGWPVEKKITQNQTINVPEPLTPTFPSLLAISSNFEVDTSIANHNINSFANSASSINEEINLLSSPQLLSGDLKLPSISTNSNVILNLEVSNTVNLYSFLNDDKHESPNITLNVKGSGTLNLIFNKGLKMENTKFNIFAQDSNVNIFFNEALKISENSALNITTSNNNNKARIYLNKGAEIKGLAKVQSIYSNKDIYIHENAQLTADDIYIDDEELNIDKHGVVTAKNIKIINGDILDPPIKISDFGTLNAHNIFIQKGHLKLNKSSKVNAHHIAIEKGSINMYESAKYVELNAQDIYLYDGYLELEKESIVNAKNVYLKNGHIKLDDKTSLTANNILIDKGSLKISLLSDSSTVNTNNIFINEGFIRTENGSKITAKDITILDAIGDLDGGDGTARDGEIYCDKGAIIIADTIYAKERIRMYARMNLNTLYTKEIVGKDTTRVNAQEDLGEGHYIPGNPTDTSQTSTSFLDPSQLISSKPVVEVQ